MTEHRQGAMSAYCAECDWEWPCPSARVEFLRAERDVYRAALGRILRSSRNATPRQKIEEEAERALDYPERAIFYDREPGQVRQ